MVDFLNFETNAITKKRLKDLSQRGQLFEDTRANALYHYNIKITQKAPLIYVVEGSLHKLHNYRKTEQTPQEVGNYIKTHPNQWKAYGNNANFFSCNEVITEIKSLCNLLEIAPEQGQIKRVEIGFNIKLPPNFETETFLNSVFMIGNKSQQMTRKYNGDFLEFDFSDYLLKIYNKGKQFRKILQKETGEQILRVEIKSKKMRIFKVLNTLQDLLNIEKLKEAGAFVLDKFSEVRTTEEVTHPNELKKYLKARKGQTHTPNPSNYYRPDFWEKLHPVQRQRETKEEAKQRANYTTNRKGQTLLELAKTYAQTTHQPDNYGALFLKYFKNETPPPDLIRSTPEPVKKWIISAEQLREFVARLFPAPVCFRTG